MAFCCCFKPLFTLKITSNLIPKHHINAVEYCHSIFKKKDDVTINSLNNKTYVTIEGTDSLKNWVDNLSLCRRSDDIHKGFRRYALEVMRKYKLLEVLKSNDEIVLSGYSSGAACVVIVIYEYLKTIKEPINNNIELVLFGSPKPGGKIFKNKFDEILSIHGIQITSYKNGNDLVCHLPPKFMGYYDICDINNIISNKKSCIKNHMISCYVENITKT